MLDCQITMTGNLTADPRVNQTKAGVVVATLRVACNSRYFERTSGTWKDAAPVFLSVSCWRALAVNAGSSLHKGDRVVVVGRLRQREYETDDHQQRTVVEIDADVLAVDLSRAAVTVQRTARELPGGEGFDPRDWRQTDGSGEPPAAGASLPTAMPAMHARPADREDPGADPEHLSASTRSYLDPFAPAAAG